MLTLETPEDLARLIRDQVFETLTLEFEASAALARSSDARRELIKDVIAFANAAGGQIVYGIAEGSNGVAAGIDEGVDTSIISPEWISQVIETNASPRVASIEVTSIVLSEGRAAYVIKIPQAVAFAPHQNLMDHKYYKRHDKRAVPMADYEIRDLMNRITAPFLALDIVFSNGEKSYLPKNNSQIFELIIKMENISPEPALHSGFVLLIDRQIDVLDATGWVRKPNVNREPYHFSCMQKLFMTPPDFPLMKGSHVTIGPPFIKLRYPDNVTIDSVVVGYTTICTRHSSEVYGIICRHPDGNLEISIDSRVSG